MKRSKRRTRKKNKKALIIVGFILIIIGLALAYKFYNKPKVQSTKKLDEISGYPYILYDNASPLYKELFKKLQKELKQEEINKEEYAKLVASLFVAEFYHLDNKITASDIGATEFVHPDIRENFALKASDSLYKGIENNIYGKRKQELPKVYKIIDTKVEQIVYEKDQLKSSEAYKVTINWEYAKDMGYPITAEIVLVNEEKLLYLVDLK